MWGVEVISFSYRRNSLLYNLQFLNSSVLGEVWNSLCSDGRKPKSSSVLNFFDTRSLLKPVIDISLSMYHYCRNCCSLHLVLYIWTVFLQDLSFKAIYSSFINTDYHCMVNKLWVQKGKKRINTCSLKKKKTELGYVQLYNFVLWSLIMRPLRNTASVVTNH